MVHLPFHAAGNFEDYELTDSALDRVISSSSSSVRALIQARNRVNSSADTSSVTKKALIVAMPDTPEVTRLPYVVDEKIMLVKICASLGLTPVYLQDQTKREFLQNIDTATILHFAGNGRTDVLDPSQSSLLLQDWQTDPLTVGDLRSLRLHKRAPFLGYLSACSTGVNEKENLADEGINIIDGLQLAGLQHVIGTLWEVSDPTCADIASTVYKTLLDEGLTDRAVALGLHKALRELRAVWWDKWRERLKNIEDSRTSAEDGNSIEGRDGRLGGKVKSKSNPMKESMPLPVWVPFIHHGK